MKLRIAVFSVILTLIMVSIGWLFWEQEVKYALPTPVPTNFVDTKISEEIDLSEFINTRPGKKTLLHFFSNDCPCSKFNMKDFEGLAKKYEKEIDFYVIIQSDKEEDLEDFESEYGLDVPTILDKEGAISDLCGIYSTPQAVIIDANSKLFYKGNYNKARFCTRKETRFVEVAIKHLLAGEELPLYAEFTFTQPYGCTLPSDKEHHIASEGTFLNIFN